MWFSVSQTYRNLKPLLPSDIVFLRTITAANPVSLPDATDVFFDILAADDQLSFDVQKRSHQGMIMGKRKEHCSYLLLNGTYGYYIYTCLSHKRLSVTNRLLCPPSGVVRQVKPVIGPKNLVLQVAMNYVKSGVITHRNVVIIHVFVSEYWF